MSRYTLAPTVADYSKIPHRKKKNSLLSNFHNREHLVYFWNVYRLDNNNK